MALFEKEFVSEVSCWFEDHLRGLLGAKLRVVLQLGCLLDFNLPNFALTLACQTKFLSSYSSLLLFPVCTFLDLLLICLME